MELPQSIKNLIKKIQTELGPTEIILFGSRARGDYRINSDYDIAVKFKNLDKKKWAKFLVDIEEDIITLYAVDLVNYDDMNELYKKNIDTEGVRLHV